MFVQSFGEFLGDLMELADEGEGDPMFLTNLIWIRKVQLPMTMRQSGAPSESNSFFLSSAHAKTHAKKPLYLQLV